MAAVLCAVLQALAIDASRAEPSAPATIYFFWGDGCPHCAEAEPFLEKLVDSSPRSELRAFEVWRNDDNAAFFAELAAAHGFEAAAVPTIIIGNRYWIGYSTTVARQIEDALRACLDSGCTDAAALLEKGHGRAEAAPPRSPVNEIEVIRLPLIGTVDLEGQALWVSTALISFVDGFNPCSLWVLSILVALALHTGSRRKVLLIGTVFITVTGTVYALFIAGLFTVLSVMSFAGWIQIAVALIALAFGAVNVKDYFFYKEGVSFTIDDRRKPGMYQRMRSVIGGSGSYWAMAAATAALAVGVSMIEFSCTAGFPILWTNLLAAQQVPAPTFVSLLLLYLVIYQLDEMIIFLLAVFTLKASRVEERQGRILKLVGGVLMLTLALVMVIDPAAMNSMSSALAIFAIAVALTGIVLLVHRRILPAFGLWIGNEEPPERRAPLA